MVELEEGACSWQNSPLLDSYMDGKKEFSLFPRQTKRQVNL